MTRLHIAFFTMVGDKTRPGRIDIEVEHPPFDGDDLEELEGRIAASYEVTPDRVIISSWQQFDEPVADDADQPEAVDEWLDG